MNLPTGWVAAAIAIAAAGCASRSASLPAMEMRFYETSADAAPKERLHHKAFMNVALIGDAALHYTRPSELLKAAETDAGGDPQKLMRAGRTLAPGDGVVLLGTVRANDGAGGGTAALALYSVALGCQRTDLDAPGDLKGCRGYLMRVTRTWPAEVYELENATVSLIPEGGTARGRMKAQSAAGGFRADVEGEFTASVLELSRVQAPPSGPVRSAK
ncbi:MAG TPA: hypothetical protein VE618_09330 [Myxococcaceae bacterium]|nr:hypothetical protein [Myxococcaceae bacterium]